MSKDEESNSKNLDDKDLFQTLIGVLLLGAGLFMLSKRVVLHSNWYMWRMGDFNLSSGTVTIPLIIGMIWYFFNPKSKIAKVLIVLSVIFIILTIIMSIRINFIATSMFDYVLIFAMTAAGTGLLLRSMFKKGRKE